MHGKSTVGLYFPIVIIVIYAFSYPFNSLIIGIASRDLHICFLVSIDRSEIPTPFGAVRLLLKFCFPVEVFDFRVSA
jgi:hypothetical protein